MTGSYTAINNNGSSAGPNDSRVNVGTVGLTLNVPLCAGFAIRDRIKQLDAFSR